ncbi:hypothetical protein PIB30_069433, partial [Stylosanthes scabra]|nr:hypothetical protein [Stylosanthes scabra]
TYKIKKKKYIYISLCLYISTLLDTNMAKSSNLADIFSLLLLILAISITNEVGRAVDIACNESWNDAEGCKEVGYVPCKLECARKHGSTSYAYCQKSHCICNYVCFH